MNLITTEILDKLDEIEKIIRPHQYPNEDVELIADKLECLNNLVYRKRLKEKK